MGTEFIASGVWSRITKLARRVPGDVAVAYCARGARKLLPLKRGSRLVVDASERAVKSGQTDPAELLYFINRGVAVHSVENLHAKVFVFADAVFLGSMNVSRRSASVLQEAAVLITDRSVVAEARRFVESHLGEEVTAEHARQLRKLYKPPQIGHAPLSAPRRRSSKGGVPEHPPLWVVPLTMNDWDEDDEREAKRARPAAARRVRRGAEELQEFAWVGASLCEHLEKGHLVLQVVKDGRQWHAYQAAHVIDIRRFEGPRGARRMVVFLAARLHAHRKGLRAVRAALGGHQRLLPNGWLPRLVRVPAAAHALLNLWGSGGERRK
ncbi:phospholipase D family protein [Sorangium sp. So ce448]|uniref:phospholipase D family protein n=1 Tax=Sorangium sp. So ce448 TaxID=3133314 RepID=UPI003F625C52